MEINKLKFFSKKTNRELELSMSATGTLSENVLYNWINNGWVNSGGKWLNSGWNNSSSDWMNSGWSNSGGGCFITTACVEHMGFSDTCDDLMILRDFRDKLVKQDPDFREKVLDYYRKGPDIVQKIMEQPDCEVILDSLYYDMVQPCVALLKAQNIESAVNLYYGFYEKLVEQYLSSQS